MDEREQKGLVIAATSKITQSDGLWVVPSQSGSGRYRVAIGNEGQFCSCPDFEKRGQACKHIHAVTLILRRESVVDANGTTTITETAAVKITYAQNWPAYNAAQCGEKDHFLRLLHDLVAKVETPEQKGAGRRRLPLSDMLFAAAYKVYSGFSGRRFQSDLRAARDQGLIAHAPAFNTIFDVLRSDEVTPVLYDLVEQTALPLVELEQDFAADSTGFGTSNFFRYYSMKYKGEQVDRRGWVKTHVMVGTRTNVITAVKIGGMNDADCPQLPELVEKTAKNFDMREVSADKAYISRNNLEIVELHGAVPFIPFKKQAVAVSRSHARKASATWTRLYHYFAMHREEFLSHYHKRSNVEATFSSVKRVLSGNCRTRGPIAQVNEVLLKLVCHNIRMLIHEAHELGISPMLEQFSCAPIADGVR